MQRLAFYGDAGLEAPETVPRRRTVADVAVVLLLVAAVVAVGLHAPSNLYAYAQLKRIGTAVGMLQTGNFLLPRNQTGGLASKPQLYPWLVAAAIRLTGSHTDFIFRLPTIAASLLTGVAVYFLGRRWYGRRAGLLAACLWATVHHMGKMATLAATDMLLTLWITTSILCADRLLFHRAARRQRWKWAVGLWASMILGALTKGWGLVNLVLVGGTLALAAAAGPGFPALRAMDGPAAKTLLAARFVLRRWWRAMRATRFGWGLLAMAVVLVPLWIGMVLQWGEEFGTLIYFEFFQRFTGAGEHAPKESTVPAALSLLYYLLPASVFAVGAILLAPAGWSAEVREPASRRWDRVVEARRGALPGLIWQFAAFVVLLVGSSARTILRRWFSRRGAICLPLCWMLAVLVPFSLSHGFRPDYLLPCYAAGALMGAWAVETLLRRRPEAALLVRVLRHVFAAAAIVAALAVTVVSAGCLFHDHLGRSLREAWKLPTVMATETWAAVWALLVLGPVGGVLAVIWSLQWRLRRVVAVAMAATVGVMFLYTHALSRHARTGDGETMIRFSRKIAPLVAGGNLVVHRAAKLGVEPYLGRLGVPVQRVTLQEFRALRRAGADVRRLCVPPTEDASAPAGPLRPAAKSAHRPKVAAIDFGRLDEGSPTWLVTCDRGLAELGAYRADPNGPFTMKAAREGEAKRSAAKFRIEPLRGELGLCVASSAPIQSQNWGRIHLIRLGKLPVRVTSRPLLPAWESGKRDEDD